MHPTDAASWKFAADQNGDGVTDLIGVKMNNTESGMTEVYVLDGSSRASQPSELFPDPLNAILFDLEPTGASAETAGYDNLPGGVASSRQMAEMDAATIFQFAERFEIAGDTLDLPPALLAAIASRESRGGRGLDENGEGDGGNGVGIMQIDKRFHSPVNIGSDFDSQGHINQAAKILLGNFEQARADYPEWGEAIQLQAATAAYNRGAVVFEDGPGALTTRRPAATIPTTSLPGRSTTPKTGSRSAANSLSHREGWARNRTEGAPAPRVCFPPRRASGREGGLLAFLRCRCGGLLGVLQQLAMDVGGGDRGPSERHG